MMRGASIAGYAEAAALVGLDPRALLRQLDIDRRVLYEPELRIPAQKVFELLELSAQVSGCETFGLRMAAVRRLSDYGPIALLLAHQPTMRDSLMTLIRYQRMLNQALLIDVEDIADDVVIVREEFVSGGEVALRQSYDLALGTMFRIFSDPNGPRLRPRRVHFARPAPADTGPYRQFFGTTVQFSSEFNGFTCERAEFDSVSASADPALARYAAGFINTLPFAESASLPEEVQRAINVLLPFNGASITSVSTRLGLSERTLQRRLADEGAEFGALLNAVRRQHALRHLANGQAPLSQVAGFVGYSRQTSFSRWFAGEFGMTPSTWRSSGRQA
jgi:AraC-like DNA-binding protein